MPWRLVIPVVVGAAVVAILLLTGGTDRKPATFGARADSICRTAQRQLAAIPPPRSLGELAAVSVSTSALTAQLADDLRGVRGDPSDAAAFSGFVEALDRQAQTMRRVQTAVRDGRRGAARRFVKAGAAAQADARRFAARLEAPGCELR